MAVSDEASPAPPPGGDAERLALLQRARAKARARRDAALGRPRGTAADIRPPESRPTPPREAIPSTPPPSMASEVAAPISAGPPPVPSVRRSALADAGVVEPGRADSYSSMPGDSGPAAPRLVGGQTSSRSLPPVTTMGVMARGLGARRIGERVAALERGAPPWVAAARLSPRMTAVFGAIFGLATITTVIALLIQSVPPRDDREMVAAALGSSTVRDEASAADAAASARSKPAKRVRQKVPGPWRIADVESDPSLRVVSQEMDRRAFVTALGEAGVDKSQVYRVLKAFDGQRKFDKASRKDRFTVAVDRKTKAMTAFEYVVSPFEIWQARQNEQGLLVASRLDLKVGTEEVVGAFYVAKSLARSIEWSSLEPGVDKALDEAFEGHTSSEAWDEGGTVRVIAMERTALGDFAGYASIVGAEYRGPDPSKPPLRVYSFTGTKSKGYFDERGRQPDGGGWSNPVPGAPITSRFNPKRLHPILKKVHPHNGTDYGAPTGTPVIAAYRGTVTWVGARGAAGNLVLIEHPNGVETGYYHLSRYADGLKVGQKVAGQQLIGYVGSTGRSTGPHLHFAAKRDGKFFDAETLRMGSFRVVDVDDRPAFLRHKAELDARLDAIALPEPPPVEPEPKELAQAGEAEPATAGEGGPGAEDDARAAGDGTAKDAKDADASKATRQTSAKKDESPDGDLEDLVGADLR